MQPSLYHNPVRSFPQPQHIQKLNHQHISKHVKRGLYYIQFWSIHIFPFHWHFSDLDVEDAAQHEQLDVECPSFNVEDAE